MARAGLLDHRKFKKLVYLLREPIPHCVGYLECLWTVAYQQRDPFLGDSLDVELAAQYPGQTGKLCESLLQVGFIDILPDGNYQVHDLADHAPRHVRIVLKAGNKDDQDNQDSDDGDQEDAEDEPSDDKSPPQGAQPAPIERPLSAQSAPSERLVSAQPAPDERTLMVNEPEEKRREEKRRELRDKKIATTAEGFAKPTVAEVAAYCRERGSQIDPEQFVDYYEARGWKSGKSAIKDWKACVRTWDKNAKSQAGSSMPPAATGPPRAATDDEVAHAKYNPQSGWVLNSKTCRKPDCQRPECVAARNGVTDGAS